MRKIKYILLLIIVMQAIVMSPVLAAKVHYEEGKRVYDYADLLTNSEEERLEEYALSIEDEAETEFYILTTDDAEGKSAMEFADDFGDEGNFGYGSSENYVLMLIDMDNREVWISTTGDAIDYLTDSRIDDMLDEIMEYVPDDCYKAGETYLDEAYDYICYGEDDGDTVFGIVLMCLFGSAVVSGIVLLVMVSGAKTKMTVGSATYMGAGGITINQREDIYTHTTTTKHRIESSSSGGGGSSTHRSSSGRRHGGGGRKF
ncbi:MAG: TPM domain-containing protein [Lachnospiraceae bacterium]|nr:TPM domain-containing protein [Lachnospiraceae bacterium]